MKVDLYFRHAPSFTSSFSACLSQLLASSQYAFEDHTASPFVLLFEIPSSSLKKIIRELGRAGGIHFLHHFLRLGLRNPQKLLKLSHISREVREQPGIHLATTAISLAIIQRYHFDQYFHPIVALVYRNDDMECEIIADYLENLAGGEKALHRLMRKLSTQDEHFREYLLFLISFFQDRPYFSPFRERLYLRYLSEPNKMLRETYEYLFLF